MEKIPVVGRPGPNANDTALFLQAGGYLDSGKDHFGQQLLDWGLYPCEKALQYAPECLRATGGGAGGSHMRSTDESLGDWKYFSKHADLVYRFGKDDLDLMIDTIKMLRPNCLWSYNDSPWKYNELEDELVGPLRHGEYYKDYVVTVPTKNREMYPHGVRRKIVCSPTSFGMYDVNDLKRFFDGMPDYWGNKVDGDFIRWLTSQI